MNSTEQEEYMAEFRAEVCSRCVERPPGGPPCSSLGKPCAIEVALPHFVETMHHVQSDYIEPYTDLFHDEVCSRCPYQSEGQCPCPIDYLLILAVQAIETVAHRHKGEPIPTISDSVEERHMLPVV